MRSKHHSKKSKPKGPRGFRPGDTVTGRLVAHRDGYGFVIPDESLSQIQGDIFIGQHSMGSAMHGDRVLTGNVRVRPDGRADGRIERVLERAQETLVGRYHHGTPFNYVVPYDERISSPIMIPNARYKQRHGTPGEPGAPSFDPERMDGTVVEVEITRFPTATQSATGKVLEILGREGEFGIDVEIIIRKHHLRHRFPPEVKEEAANVPGKIPDNEIRRRRDFRDLPIVTIDGETARDFDDAVMVERLPNGNFQLQVHIADVSYYVRPGSALDREARLRGTSVYFPDRAVPMLPSELSTGICSLNPGEDRLVLSVTLEIDRQGAILNSSFGEGIIRSARRMTYTAVNLVLENDPEIRDRYGSLLPHFEAMRELALILNKKRVQRGSVDFDLPEPVIKLNEMGVMVNISRSERNIAHRLIEEFMLAANEAVAAHIEGAGLGSLYRIHEEPDPRKVIEFEEIASSFGYTLGVGPLPVKTIAFGQRDSRRGRSGGRGATVNVPSGSIKISPRHYQKLTQTIAGKPEERILSYLMLRSLKQATYREQNEGHFALATPCYTHFTSPIRRYPDLVVHRILRYLIENGGQGVAAAKGERGASGKKRSHKPEGNSKKHGHNKAVIAGPISQVELQEIGLESSEDERRAQEAERELMEWKKARFMSDKLGDDFDALIISVNKYGFFVELIDMFIEGQVPINSFSDQRYFYREQQQQWVGERNRRSFRIGDRLRVRLDRIGEMGGKMSFSVVDQKELKEELASP